MPRDEDHTGGHRQQEEHEELPPVIEAEGVLARIRRFLADPDRVTLLSAGILFIGVLYLLSESVEIARTIKETVQSILAAGFELPANGAAGPGEVRPWLVVLVTFALGVVFVAAVYAFSMYRRARKLRNNLKGCTESRHELAAGLRTATSERDQATGALAQALAEKETWQREREESKAARDTLKEQLDGIVSETVRTVSMISRGMFSGAAKAKGKTFRFVRVKYEVSRDFTATVHRRYIIRAGDVPLHLWGTSMDAPSEAKPMANFADIQFRLIGLDTKSDAVYLPAENDLFNKQACVFFLPSLQPAEEREFEIVYRWPGLLLGLQKNGWEDLTFSFRSAGVIEEFELELYLENGTGGNLSGCKQIGVNLPGHEIAPVTNDQGWLGYRYIGRNIPPELLSEEIAARVEWRRA